MNCRVRVAFAHHIPMTASPRIIPVRTPADLLATIALFRAYAASLDVDLGYQVSRTRWRRRCVRMPLDKPFPSPVNSVA